MDRGAWWATVHGVAKSQTLSDLKKKKILCTVSYCYQQRACSVLHKSSKNMTDVELNSPSKSCSDIMGKRTKLPSNQKPAGATPQSRIPNLYYSNFTGRLQIFTLKAIDCTFQFQGKALKRKLMANLVLSKGQKLAGFDFFLNEYVHSWIFF